MRKKLFLIFYHLLERDIIRDTYNCKKNSCLMGYELNRLSEIKKSKILLNYIYIFSYRTT